MQGACSKFGVAIARFGGLQYFCDSWGGNCETWGDFDEFGGLLMSLQEFEETRKRIKGIWKNVKHWYDFLRLGKELRDE